MKKKAFITGALAVIVLISCSKKATTPSEPVINNTDSIADKAPVDSVIPADVSAADAAHNSQNSLDWDGTYEVTVPCSDCPGIKTSLTLNKDNTFSLTEEYINKTTTNTDNGIFKWNSAGNTIILNGKTSKYQYKIEENKLLELDMEGKKLKELIKTSAS